MVEFKLVIGDPASRRTYQKALSGADVEKLIGLKIGDSFHGELIGLPGYELKITGGSDNAGFPMRVDVSGRGRAKLLITRSVGFKNIKKRKRGEEVLKSRFPGRRKRRTVRGNTISEMTAQVNCRVAKIGKESVAKLLGIEIKEAPKAEAAPTENKAPEKAE